MEMLSQTVTNDGTQFTWGTTCFIQFFNNTSSNRSSTCGTHELSVQVQTYPRVSQILSELIFFFLVRHVFIPELHSHTLLSLFRSHSINLEQGLPGL